MGIALTILALLVVGALIGSTLNFAGVFLGIPLVFLFIGAILGREEFARRNQMMQMKRFRRDAQAKKHPLTERDKRTVI